jgi:hypothetical protein
MATRNCCVGPVGEAYGATGGNIFWCSRTGILGGWAFQTDSLSYRLISLSFLHDSGDPANRSKTFLLSSIDTALSATSQRHPDLYLGGSMVAVNSAVSVGNEDESFYGNSPTGSTMPGVWQQTDSDCIETLDRPMFRKRKGQDLFGRRRVG